MSSMLPVCPLCSGRHRQTKAGRAINGNQRYQCQDCKRYYVAVNRRFRYPLDLRQKALELYTSGLKYRQIGRLLSVNHQTISNWIESEASKSRPHELLRSLSRD